MNNELLNNISKIHTTKLGVDRIKKNLNLECDIVDYCKKIVLKSNIYRKGKNWYCEYNNIVLTINANNYCIITAHKKI